MLPLPGRLRPRLLYAALALSTIAVGLCVHLFGRKLLPPASRDILGDALWAAMMLWWVGALAPRLRIHARLGLTLGICFAVEASQLYHTPGLDALRRTRMGHLILGSGFDPRDLAAYTLGALAAALLVERTLLRRCRAGAAGASTLSPDSGCSP